jgi:hypothetical protein
MTSVCHPSPLTLHPATALRLLRCRRRCRRAPRSHRRAGTLRHSALLHPGTRSPGATLHPATARCLSWCTAPGSPTTAAAAPLDPASLLRHPAAHGAELFRREDRAEFVFLLPLGRLTAVADVAHRVAVTVLDGPQLGALLGREFGSLLALHPGLLGNGRRVLGNHRRDKAGGHEGEEWAERHRVLHVGRLCRVGTERTRLVRLR